MKPTGKKPPRQEPPEEKDADDEQQSDTSTGSKRAIERRQRYSMPEEPEQADSTAVSLDLILQRLDAMSADSQDARDKLASEARKERESIKKSLALLQAKGAQILSDDDETVGEASGLRVESNPASGNAIAEKQTGTGVAVRYLRDDKASSKVANEVLTRTGLMVDEQSQKKLKSGYNLTINDQIHTIAQWPQRILPGVYYVY